MQAYPGRISNINRRWIFKLLQSTAIAIADIKVNVKLKINDNNIYCNMMLSQLLNISYFIIRCIETCHLGIKYLHLY